MKEFYRRHLPHWQPQDAVFFVTFRLKNSMPYEIIESLRKERERAKIALQRLPQSERAKQDYLDERRYFGKWDTYLDKAEFGPRWLAQPEIADVVKEALHYRDGKVFDLHAFCIMLNHVHAVFQSRSGGQPDLHKSGGQPDLHKSGGQPDLHKSEWHADRQSKSGGQPDLHKSEWHADRQSKSGGQPDLHKSEWHSDLQPDLPLSKIMQSLKRHTARQANIILGREGAFWQDESYDHVVRDNEEHIRIMNYVLENPVKAGLVSNWEDWRWAYLNPEILS
jgi:REP element-mobilizing transposase RayT